MALRFQARRAALSLAPAIVLCIAPSWTMRSPASQSTSQPASPPWQRLLSGQDKKDVEAMEEQIIQFRQQTKYTEALTLAEKVASIRSQEQGRDHWQALDARLEAQTIKKIASLPAAQQAGLATIDKQKPLLLDMETQGAFEKGAELAKKAHDLQKSLLGESNEEALASLNKLACFLDHQGDSAEAERILRGLITRQTSLLGAVHPSVAETYSNLGDTLQKLDKYEEAEQITRQAVEMLIYVHGDQGADTAQALSNLGYILHEQGKYKEAEPIYRRALEALSKETDGSNRLLATVKTNLGVMLIDTGKFSAAEALLIEALAMYRSLYGNVNFNVGVGLNNLAMLYDAMGDYPAAENAGEEALSILRKVAPQHVNTATVMDNLGGWLETRGALDRALSLRRAALAMRVSLNGAESSDVAVSYHNMAFTMCNAGDLASSESCYRKALNIYRKALGEQSEDAADTSENLALVLAAKGDIEEAEQIYRVALATKRKFVGNEHFSIAVGQNNLADILRRMGRHELAEPMIVEALRIMQAQAPNHPFVGRLLSNLGVCRRLSGDFEGAEVRTRQSIDFFKTLGAVDPESLATSLHNLGIVLAEQQRFDDAESAFAESLAVFRQVCGDAHPLIARTLNSKAELKLKLGRILDAEKLFRDSLGILEPYRTRVLGDERARAGVAGEIRIDWTASMLATTLIRLGKYEEALTASERGRARGLLDLMIRSDRDLIEEARRVGGQTAMRVDECLAKRDQTRWDITAAEKLLAGTTARVDLGKDKARMVALAEESLRKNRDRLGDAERELQESLQSLWPEARPFSAEEIRKALFPGELLICYDWTDEAVSVVAVEAIAEDHNGGSKANATRWMGAVIADGNKVVADLASRVTNIASGFADLLAKKQPDRSMLQQDLCSQLMPGSLYNQARAAKRVIIRPTGPLASLPLEALDSIGSANYDDSGSGSLIDIFPPFVYVDSSSAFAAHRSARRKPPGSDKQAGTFSALLVGNPEFNRSERSPATAPTSAPVTLLASISRGIEEEAAQITALDQVRLYGGKLKPLPAASREVEVLDLLFKRHGGRSHLLSGRSATIAQVEYAVEGCNILHMATHGLTGSRNRPYDASLALAQPAVPTPSDIGFLTLNRLVESWRGKLQQCDLVVLSACDTQRGVKRGDSVMALPWGFMYAGAPTVVASLWQVDDLSTSILMEEFYRNLLEKKLGKAEALHAAKRTLQDMSLEEVRRHSGMSAEQFTDYAARGLGQGIVKIPKGRLRSAAPYAHPYYWAAFVLIGDPQ